MKITKATILSLMIILTFSLSGCDQIDAMNKYDELKNKYDELQEAHNLLKEEHDILKNKQANDIKKMLN